MKIYHEVSAESVDSIFKNGLKRTSRGTKGDDDLIAKTDEFLDAHRPSQFRSVGLSRNSSIYGYIGSEDSLISIKDGSSVAIHKKKAGGSGVLLELTVDPERCWVSDLDAYDELKTLFEHEAAKEYLVTQAQKYWNLLIPLRAYKQDTISRPEVMITYDIDPAAIQKA